MSAKEVKIPCFEVVVQIFQKFQVSHAIFNTILSTFRIFVRASFINCCPCLSFCFPVFRIYGVLNKTLFRGFILNMLPISVLELLCKVFKLWYWHLQPCGHSWHHWNNFIGTIMSNEARLKCSVDDFSSILPSVRSVDQ